jgi:hypothetical protein
LKPLPPPSGHKSFRYAFFAPSPAEVSPCTSDQKPHSPASAEKAGAGGTFLLFRDAPALFRKQDKEATHQACNRPALSAPPLQMRRFQLILYFTLLSAKPAIPAAGV